MRKKIKWVSIPVGLAVIVAIILTMLPVGVSITGEGVLSIGLSRTYANPAASITVSPISYDFGIVGANSTFQTGLTYFTLTNDGDVGVNITIQGTDMTGGVGWTLSDTATPGTDIVGLKSGTKAPYSTIGFSGGDQETSVGFAGGDEQDLVGFVGQGDYSVVIKKTATFNTIIYKMPPGSSIKWGFAMYVPTEFTDGVEKTGTITLTATAV